MDFEKVLPSEMRLGENLQSCEEDIRLEINDTRSRSETFDFINYELSPSRLLYAASIADFFEKDFLGDGSEINRRRWTVMSRASLFALQTLDMVYGDGSMSGEADYVERLIKKPTDEAYGELIQDVHDYLDENTAVHEYLCEYLAEIDVKGSYRFEAMVVAGLVLMAGERNVGEQFIIEEGKTITPESIINGELGS